MRKLFLMVLVLVCVSVVSGNSYADERTSPDFVKANLLDTTAQLVAMDETLCGGDAEASEEILFSFITDGPYNKRTIADFKQYYFAKKVSHIDNVPPGIMDKKEEACGIIKKSLPEILGTLAQYNKP